MVEWIDAENTRLESERQKVMQERGEFPYWKAPKGVTRIEVLAEKPATDSKFSGKKQLHIIVVGVESIWTINTKSPLWRVLIERLKSGKTKFDVMRIGTDKEDTKYELMDVVS